jgi:hypothetical protein
MLLELLQTVSAVEEAPAEEVEATTELTTELLWTLNIGNLLEQLVLRVEVSEVEVTQTCTCTYLVNPVNSLLCRTIQLVLTLSSTQQNVRVAHQAKVDTAMQTSNHLFVNTCTEVGILCDGQTTIVIVGNQVIVSCQLCCIGNIAILKAFPLGLVSSYRPVKTWVETTINGTLCLEEVVQPRRS